MTHSQPYTYTQVNSEKKLMNHPRKIKKGAYRVHRSENIVTQAKPKDKTQLCLRTF